MLIVHRYLLREIVKYFGLVLILVTGLYFIVDLFQKLDDFLEKGLSVMQALKYIVLKTPLMIAQILPICALLAVLVVFGLMSKKNELIALRGGGASASHLVKPVLGLASMLVLILYFLSEVAVPITIVQANRIWIEEVKGKSVLSSKQRNLWIKNQQQIIYIRYSNPDKKAISGVTLYYFDDDFRLIRRVDAEKGVFKNAHWTLSGVMDQTMNPETQQVDVALHQTKPMALGLFPEDLQLVTQKAEEMNLAELAVYIRKVESEGYDANEYRVNWHAKIAFPFSCIILCLLGAGLALTSKRKEALALTIASGVGLAFLYWVLHSFCVSLGYGETLQPLVAAWIANGVFLCVGLWILLKAE